ncbi:hypothetical protein [Rhizobium leguminosarum]|uniref:hypothetical protein n=1 Tax=Rhizobium leguminosarum TaxID=384 RepID=UPI001C96F04B|nr:hypothetical protein [Rhizobium leguminosarum]MBY5751412.1 hypothetical protein [Rhizobium leguminosarum]
MEAAKERFAGANSLALPVEKFELHYPRLAEDVARYTAFIQSKNKKTKYVLAPRLALGCIESDERFHDLRDYLRHPENLCARRNEFQEPLQVALRTSYERLAASGLYSPAIATEHGRNAISVFRWLGRNIKFYPELPRWLPLVERNFKGPRKKTDVPAPFQGMPIDEIEALLGEQFIRDLRVYQAVAPGGRNRVLGFRYLMSFVRTTPSEYSDMLLGALAGAAEHGCDATTVKLVIEACEDALVGSRAFSPATISGWMGDCGRFFEHLSDLPDRNYPHYSRRYKKFGYVPPESSTLGDLDFAETRGLGGVARLRASIDVVRNAAMDAVNGHASFFAAAQPMREGRNFSDLPTDQREACTAVATVVRAEIRSLKQTGMSQFSKNGVRTNARKVDLAMEVLATPATWLVAGLGHLVPDVVTLEFQQIMTLISACIGATSQTVLAAKLVFCCETGWNRQPIDDIPAEVYQFRLTDEAGVASASFVSVFKNRAGHLVQTLLEHSELSGGRATDAVATWEEAEREKSWGTFDQRCMLSYTSPAYEALERIRPMVEALNAFTNDPDVKAKFFKSISLAGGVSTFPRAAGHVFKSGVLSTPGLTFRLVRKTYLQLMLRVVGSVESLHVHAGHSGTGVLLPYYLNSPDVKRELEQSTRFFQNAVQSLVAAEVGGTLRLMMSDEDHEWFYNLARISGIASAVGYDVSAPVAGPPGFEFAPSDENVRALLAIDMALDVEEKTADPRRWALVGVPLRGFVAAILSKLRAASMARLIKRVGAELTDDVKKGAVVLPPLKPPGILK